MTTIVSTYELIARWARREKSIEEARAYIKYWADDYKKHFPKEKVDWVERFDKELYEEL